MLINVQFVLALSLEAQANASEDADCTTNLSEGHLMIDLDLFCVLDDLGIRTLLSSQYKKGEEIQMKQKVDPKTKTNM